MWGGRTKNQTAPGGARLLCWALRPTTDISHVLDSGYYRGKAPDLGSKRKLPHLELFGFESTLSSRPESQSQGTYEGARRSNKQKKKKGELGFDATPTQAPFPCGSRHLAWPQGA